MHECDFGLRFRNLMKKSKTISKQASKIAKYRFKKNSRNIQNLINCRHENRGEYQVCQYSTQSEKSKSRTTNA